MFDSGFASLFRAIDRIREQLETADSDLRRLLGDELVCIQRLGERYIDYWMTLDEQIGELLEMYELPVQPEAGPTAAPTVVSQGQRASTISNPTIPSASRTFPEITVGMDSKDFLDVAFDLTDGVTVSFRKGLANYDLFMYEDAVKSFEHVVQSTETVLGRLYLSASYAATHQSEAAFAQLQYVYAATAEPLYICAADEIAALLYIEESDWKNAIERFQSIARKIPNYPDVWFNLGACYVSINECGAAAAAFGNVLKLNPADVETYRLLSYAHLKAGNVSEARQICKNGLSRQPLNIDLLRLLTVIERNAGDFNAAIRVCKRITELSPDSYQAWSMLAWLYCHTDHLSRATATLKMWLSIHPNDAQGLLHLGLIQLLNDNPEQAEEMLLQCFPSVEHKSILWMALGEISLRRGEHAKAHSRFLRAMRDKRKPLRRLAMYQYAKLLVQVEQYAEAETYLKGAALLGPPNPAIYHLLALCAKNLGRPHEASKLENQAQSLHAANSSTP